MINQISETFKTRLNLALKTKNIRPIDLSNMTGLTKSKISSYMSGRYLPKKDTLFKLAEALDCTPSWLMGYDNIKVDVKIQKIPVIGIVRAGYNFLAEENIMGHINLTEDEIKNPNEYFALKIKGDSMSPDIKEGDIALIHMQEDCESGDIAIILINGDEATVKKVIKNENSLILQPLNPTYEIKTFNKKDIKEKPVRIIGIVKRIIRIF
jgi:repressor LexA